MTVITLINEINNKKTWLNLIYKYFFAIMNIIYCSIVSSYIIKETVEETVKEN